MIDHAPSEFEVLFPVHLEHKVGDEQLSFLSVFPTNPFSFELPSFCHIAIELEGAMVEEVVRRQREGQQKQRGEGLQCAEDDGSRNTPASFQAIEMPERVSRRVRKRTARCSCSSTYVSAMVQVSRA